MLNKTLTGGLKIIRRAWRWKKFARAHLLILKDQGLIFPLWLSMKNQLQKGNRLSLRA